MRLRRRNFLHASLGFAVIGCGSDDESTESQVEILPDGEHAPMILPAGATLVAANPGEASIRSNGPGPALVVETEAGLTTTLRGVIVHSAGGVGILIRGAGDVLIEDVQIMCSAGVGFLAEGASSVTLRRVHVVGSITKTNVPMLVFPLEGTEASIVGIALSDVKQYLFEAVFVRGFGGYGALLLNSHGTWSTGAIQETVGVGLFIQGGTSTCELVEVKEIWKGEIGNAISAWAVFAGPDSVLHTEQLRVVDCEGWGILHYRSIASHDTVTVNNCDDAGMWSQQCEGRQGEPALIITGTDNNLTGNRGGGLYVIESGPIEIGSLQASNGAIKQIATSDTGLAEMADGIQVAYVRGDLTIDGAQLVDNARVGLLLHGPVDPGAVVDIRNVSVDGSGNYGVIVQEGFPSLDPSTITYGNSALETADSGITGRLPVASKKASTESMSLESFSFIGADGLLTADGLGAAGAVIDRYGLGKP
jgi:hypothetical protein